MSPCSALTTVVPDYGHTIDPGLVEVTLLDWNVGQEFRREADDRPLEMAEELVPDLYQEAAMQPLDRDGRHSGNRGVLLPISMV